MNLPQYQCFFHTSTISSMGTFLVSGRNSATKMVMMTTHAPKKKKSMNLNLQSMGRNACAMMKVHSMFTDTVMLCPADLISSGKISLGTSHPSGPHDQANPAT
uniref:Uncharacterized protein n=1 Tax=Arundo donax TaxID=35708 RepID=A0A0A9FGY6_ARUDO